MTRVSANILPYLLLATGYAGLGWMAWRELTRAPQGTATAQSSWVRSALPQALLALAFIWHALLLRETIWIEGAINFSFANALSAVTWLTALVLWIGRFAEPLASVTALLLPVTAICVLLPAWDQHPHWLRYFDQPWAALHVAVALVAFSLFIVAALQALLLMSVERRLHAGNPLPLDTTLPPLLTLERFLFRLIGVAFILLTLTVASGAFFSEELFQQPFRFTHKVERGRIIALAGAPVRRPISQNMRSPRKSNLVKRTRSIMASKAARAIPGR